MKKTCLSGMQASGHLHLGNYLGAICNWLKLQEEYNCFFFMADLHAITVPQDPKALHASVINSTSCYIASGLDPDKVAIFAQSHVKEHAELGWILTCHTPIGWLNRMTQFKDKAGKNRESASAGLYTYPALMAADILLYKPDIVPVGADQKQHIELTRDIAEAVNRKLGRDILKVPEPFIQGVATRIMSLKDGTKKMSKSDPSDQSRINMHDSADEIASKIKKAKTDSYEHISFDPEQRPEISNLLNMFAAISGKTVENLANEYENKGFAQFKGDLADNMVAHLSPINEKYRALVANEDYIKDVLKKGSEKARAVSEPYLEEIKEALGFVRL